MAMRWIIGTATIAFLSFVFLGVEIQRRALRSLTTEEKARWVDFVATGRPWAMAFVVIIIGIWFAVLLFMGQQYFIRATAAYMVLTAVWIATSRVLAYRRLQSVGMPATFLRSFLLSGAIMVGATLVLAALYAVLFFR